MKLLKIIIVLSLFPALAFAQSYNPFTFNRPAGLNWQQIKTEHFRIIFPDGEDSLAYRSAAILESHYDQTSELTGGKLKNFPVILNNYNDLSNGFVNSFNFRSEIDLADFKGKGMNPQTGDWLEIVLPHELVHATHFNVQIPWDDKKISIPNFISIFSPDLARTFHGFPPVGLHEGLAVYYETESVAPMGGRGNYTFSTNRFNSNFAGSNRWNMGQTLIPSDYTQPYNRHYIAGYSFVDWLHDNYGDEISREAIRFHYHNFFLGYGYALRRKTGKWPGQLYELYEEDLEAEEQKRLAQIPVNTAEKSTIIDTPYRGEETHAPKWITENSLLFYGSYYNGRIGFYRYDTDTEDFELIKETFGVGDYNFEIENGKDLYFSSYKRDPLYSGVYKTDIHKLDLKSGKSKQLSKKERVYAPTSNGERLLGIQGEGPGGKIVEIFPDGSIKELMRFQDASPVSLKFNPNKPDQLAVTVNRRGVQALWIADLNSLSSNLNAIPELAFTDASIHDAEWHPHENKILFTLDAPPAMNVYEYNLDTKEILQITSSLFNAFEASYSPDGQQIAYVIQQKSERKIALLHQDDFLNQPVSNSRLLRGKELRREFDRPLLGSAISDSVKSYPKTSYRGNLSWLKPRTIFPAYEEKANTTQAGVVISSIDPLSRQAYSAEITGIQNRLWYDFTYTNKMFYPGLEISAYSDPEFFATRDPNTDEAFSLMRQDRGFNLSLPFDYTFRGDTRYSALFVRPEIKAEQFKYYNLQAEELSDFSTRYRAGVFSQLSLGILNLPRDVQPSSGISLFGLYEQTLNEPTAQIEFPGGPVARTFTNQWSALYGIFGFISPLRRWNQSMRIDMQFLQQSDSPIYSNSSIIPMGFSDDIFPNYDLSDDSGFQNIGRLSTRYTIPLFYPDNGGLTIPFYLSSIYLTTFTHTLTDLNADNLLDSSRSIFGAGFHVQFKVSNVLFDLGVGFAYEPTRDNSQFIFGQF
ncbi:MAG: hypothetical protein HUJ22_11280 [Gracilimonas sp.]|uniref:hypothetical protein n=1 Tax=Gracilimonas sp. TaxID=1974203 RepID=UPI0019882DC6|nr:hypothetical protein [Gracilimonas sp.]MBD3617141.1 hypothetical protein [Gracilimonas sp.]